MAAEALLRKLRNEYSETRDGDWGEFVQWACGYDVKKELRAWGTPEEEIERWESEVTSSSP